ncbi:MAG: hypothetical protein E6K56_00230 [Ignavibacteria bacterium]|nr:MAG: hypothetical protein E6K56_00230 [Ignavibacteria bacterium]
MVFVGTDNAIYKSTNGGTTWQLLINVYQYGTYSAFVDAITISPRSATVLVSTELAGLFMSRDAGTGWSQVNFGLQVHAAFTDPDQDSTIYAATLGGFLKSIDMGRTFSLAKGGYFGGGSVHGREMVLIETDLGTIFRTTDTGASWSEKVNGITDVSIYSTLVQPGGDRSLLAIVTKGYSSQLLAFHDSQWDTIAGAYYNNYFGSRLYESADRKALYMIGGWNYVARSSDWQLRRIQCGNLQIDERWNGLVLLHHWLAYVLHCGGSIPGTYCVCRRRWRRPLSIDRWGG